MHNLPFMHHSIYLMRSSRPLKNCILFEHDTRFLKEIDMYLEYKIYGFVTPSSNEKCYLFNRYPIPNHDRLRRR